MENYTSSIARIENNFIFNAQYSLSAREQKVLLFLISNINPLERNFYTQVIPIKEIKSIILSKRSGSFYDEMLEFSARISTKQIIYDSKIKLRGKKMKGFINWFQSIVPVHNDSGDLCLKFKFSEDLKPYLLELKEYTQINYLETIPLKSSFSIRMYQIFRAYRNKMAKHQKKSKLSYELQELKILLGVGDKYKEWRDFNKYVVSVIEREINEQTAIKVKVILQRKGRKVVGVGFEIWDKRVKASTKPGTLKFESLTFAQLKAYNKLTDFGITEGISLQMLQKCGGSEISGFEDWYFGEVIRIFETKTRQEDRDAKTGVLVNWYLKKKVFEQGDMFAKIMERLAERKKKLQESDIKAWDNRQLAKGMSAEEFRQLAKG